MHIPKITITKTWSKNSINLDKNFHLPLYKKISSISATCKISGWSHWVQNQFICQKSAQQNRKYCFYSLLLRCINTHIPNIIQVSFSRKKCKQTNSLHYLERMFHGNVKLFKNTIKLMWYTDAMSPYKEKCQK